MTSHVNKFKMVTLLWNLTTEKAYLLQTIEFLRILLFSILFVLNYNWSDQLYTISPRFVIYTKLCMYDSLMHVKFNIVIVIKIVIYYILQS